MANQAEDSQLTPTPNRVGATPQGVLLSRDLIFTSKIIGTAATLGYSVAVVSNNAHAKEAIKTHRPQVVLVDLGAGELTESSALVALQALAGPDTWFVAFGSHVDVGALTAARNAGCHVVLPRSRFSAELPALLRLYFSQKPTHEGKSLGQ